MEGNAGKTKKPVWSWVLIAVGPVLLTLGAVVLTTAHAKPRLGIRFDGYAVADFEPHFKTAAFWVTNRSSRTVIFELKWYETNVLGVWRVPIKREPLSRDTMFWAESNEAKTIFLIPPEGAHIWRPRFITTTEAEGWEVYWEYAKLCANNVSHRRALPQLKNTRWFTHAQEVVGPVVPAK